MIHYKVASSLKIRLISSLILGKWISKKHWKILCNKQAKKGLKKYGHYLDDCPNYKYAWKIMAMEELVDFWNYKFKMKR